MMTLNLNSKMKKNNNIAKSKSSDENIQNTIFVGNLPNKTTLKELKMLFKQYGKIESLRLRCASRKELKIPKKLAVIKKEFHEDSNHINAYIKFENFESCKAALKMNGEVFDGHHLRVALAEDSGKSDPRKSIFVGNLAFKVKDDDLWSVFQDCGAIESVRVIRDNETGIGKGFGYVNFKSADSVELALKLNGVDILDRKVRISRALNSKSNQPSKRKLNNNSDHVSKRRNVESETNQSTPEYPERRNKKFENVKAKKGFQGRKTKLAIHKKHKKKNKFDKKKSIIKQIADGLKKVKDVT